MVQDIADDDWLARPAHAPVFEAMTAHGLVFDALVLPRHLPRLARVLERHPALAVVVDHGAKPRIREHAIDAWRADLTTIATHRQAHCKLSGLVTEAPRAAGLDALLPYIDTLLGLFGPERLAWGSDWPVVELAGGYDRWRQTSLSALTGISPAEQADVLGGTAERLYLARKRGQTPFRDIGV
jgi:L-fuconolactonase